MCNIRKLSDFIDKYVREIAEGKQMNSSDVAAMIGEEVTADEIDQAVAGCIINPDSLYSSQGEILATGMYDMPKQLVLLYKRSEGGHEVAFVDPLVVQQLRNSASVEDLDYRLVF